MVKKLSEPQEAETTSQFLANSELPSFPSARPGRMSQSFDFPIFKRCNQIETGVCRQNSVRQQIQAINANVGTDPYVINPNS